MAIILNWKIIFDVILLIKEKNRLSGYRFMLGLFI